MQVRQDKNIKSERQSNCYDPKTKATGKWMIISKKIYALITYGKCRIMQNIQHYLCIICMD
jgi:hypothetical protein